MKVVEYINKFGIEKLEEDLAIKVKRYPDGRVVLDYNMLESPKTDPIVMECRGIIFANNKIICHPFSRFFNLGEAPETQAHLDMTKAVAYEKVDGSLIKVYHHNQWEIATRGTAFAESGVNGFDITFRELVLKALGTDEEGFQERANVLLNKDVTYLFEVTAMENRVVTRYEGHKLHYLGARVTETGEFVREQQAENAYAFGAHKIKQYSFTTKEEALKSVNELGGLQEGFVVWQNGVPVAKIKADAYVAVHSIKGEGLTPKRIAELVLSGEEEEYLTYFSEDRVHIEPYVVALAKLHKELQEVWESSKHIETQKDFALAVKDSAFSGALFTARKTNTCPLHCFNESRVALKVDILKGFVN